VIRTVQNMPSRGQHPAGTAHQLLQKTIIGKPAGDSVEKGSNAPSLVNSSIATLFGVNELLCQG